MKSHIVNLTPYLYLNLMLKRFYRHTLTLTRGILYTVFHICITRHPILIENIISIILCTLIFILNERVMPTTLGTELYWVLASQLCLNGLRYIF